MIVSIFVSTFLSISCTSEKNTQEPHFDSDGDGYTDEEEVRAGSNPESAYSYPLEQGNYNIGLCPSGIEPSYGPQTQGYMAEGGGLEWMHYTVGDVVNDVLLSDQYGQEVSLYQFCGQHIMLVIGSFT